MARGNNSSRGRHAAPARSPHQGSQTNLPRVTPVSPYSRDSYGSAARAQQSRARARGPWRVVFVVSIIVLIGALAALGAIGYQYWSQQNSYSSLHEYAQVEAADSEAGLTLSDLSVDWDALRAINPDIVAWVYVPGTVVNYPVVQGSDNEKYLHTAFDGSTGWLASAGTVFLDAQNASDLSDRNSALYGHHMNDGSMFAALADFNDQATFDAHRDVFILTPQGNYHLKTFALVDTVGTDAIVQTTFGTNADYEAYIQDKIDRSMVMQNGDVFTASDVRQSMLLSTCEYSQTDGRAVLFCAVVETTVANDPYVAASTTGSKNLSIDSDGQMDRDFKEAA